MRNITSDEYDLLCTATSEKDELMHWSKVYSWTDDVYKNDASSRVIRGYNSARNSYYINVMNYNSIRGWRAAFESLNPDTDCTDLSVGDVVVMGTLYVGSNPIKVPTNPVYDGDITNYDKDRTGVTDKITLGAALEDTDYQMKAVYVGDGVFVCDRCMLNYITWNQINAALTA